MADKIIVSKSKVTNLFDSIRAKSGSTDLMSFDVAKTAVDEMSSGVIEVEELPKVGWSGTPVPNSGTVEKVYFNTNLSVEEVNEILNDIEFIDYGEGAFGYIVFANNDMTKPIVISKFDGFVDILVNNSYAIFSTSGQSYIGWNPEKENYVDLNVEAESEIEGMSIGSQNSKLSSLFSTTPFVKEEPAKGSVYKVKTKVVPDSGYVDKIWFNTSLSIDEVVSILDTLELADGTNMGSPGYDGYLIYVNGNTAEMVIVMKSQSSGLFSILWMYVMANITIPIFTQEEGWKNINVLNVNADTLMGVMASQLGQTLQQDKLINLINIQDNNLYKYKNNNWTTYDFNYLEKVYGKVYYNAGYEQISDNITLTLPSHYIKVADGHIDIIIPELVDGSNHYGQSYRNQYKTWNGTDYTIVDYTSNKAYISLILFWEQNDNKLNFVIQSAIASSLILSTKGNASLNLTSLAESGITSFTGSPIYIEVESSVWDELVSINGFPTE